MQRQTWAAATMAVAVAAGTAAQAADWAPVQGRLMTKWAKDVAPDKVLPEYPRPQMAREAWQSLNGLWDYAIVAKDAAKPGAWDGRILVPFPVESALSGVAKPVAPEQRLWYRRTFTVPAAWAGKRILLHFGAVDWEAAVTVNGKDLGTHRGGFDGFSFDITDALKAGGEQDLVVSVWDPTDRGPQARGKQVLKPGGIMYTATTGIWQTPWLEPVPAAHIASLKIVPDVDGKCVRVTAGVAGEPGGMSVSVEVRDGGKTLAVVSGKPGAEIVVPVANAKLWSPGSPHLYDLGVMLGKDQDRVASYFGMRKIALGKDAAGIQRLMLNGQPLFQFGPLDQGFWPDGIYTAPTDEALRYDIEITKAMGMNLARKHVKIEPDRWYYWCDKLGLLVWQDMPGSGVGDHKTDTMRPGRDADAKQFESEMKAMIEGRWNHPSIVMWVPFNEGWGQYDTPRICAWIKQFDPSRLVNNASGWTDRQAGDVIDMHNYPGPGVPKLEENRAAVLGEFGGLGLPVKGHSWQDEKNWGYRSFTTAEELTDAYLGLLRKLHRLTGDGGLCAAVYTQTTDCEIEVNGLLTYDREMVKMDLAAIAAAAQKLYTPPIARHSEGTTLVPPATPLVACDPYFSIWSPADALTDADTTHWTGKPHRLTGMVRIDGKPYRVLGSSPAAVPPLEQKSLTVTPTRSIYTFEGAGVAVTLTFMTPALPDDLDVLARPVTYVTFDFKATDGKTHDVAAYVDASAELAVNQPNQEVVFSSLADPNPPVAGADPLAAVKNNPNKAPAVPGLWGQWIESKDQPILAKRGDDIRIDWGRLYVAAPEDSVGAIWPAGNRALYHSVFRDNPARIQIQAATQPSPAEPIAAPIFLREVKVGDKPVSRWLMLAYDDVYSIQYMKTNLRPYWRRNGWEAADLLTAAAKDYESLKQRCEAFDAELMADLTKAGGEKYAKLCALAYRQCFAAGKFVADAAGRPLQFCKENHSNGCIGTSDVFYPMAPQFLLFGPTLAKSFLVPFMNYAASERWTFPFAPHDLGQYPHANGQRYGGGERTEDNQMPVEESGNLLCLFGAIAQMEGNADFAGLYWPQLERWAGYLKEKGFDPENQLCTDDFAGHLAHNVNLSAKAICGLGVFGKLCAMRGDEARAKEYRDLAKGFAARWVKEADAGDHFRLAFDKPDTWSQKYNLIWDRILGLDLFPPEVAKKEMAYYRGMQNKYGLPLDNRQTYTKLDWITWTATLTRNRADFEALIDPVFTYMNETTDRAPLSDWYQTKTARKVGFTARPVIGGVFVQMLYDKAVWTKWASRDRTKASGWAPFPKAPKVSVLVPTAREEPAKWHYTTQKPPEGWFAADFDDATWKEGPAGFGTKATPGAVVRTEWKSNDIWIRRAFDLAGPVRGDVQLMLHHDEDAEVFINGVPAAQAAEFTTDYEAVPMRAEALKALKQGRNVIAIHCRQERGGQYIDAGLATVEAP